MRRFRPIRNPIISGINIGMFNLVMLVVALCLLFVQFASAPTFHYALGLPRAKHSIWMPEADRQLAITIHLRGGQLWYRNDRVALPDLRARILEDLSHGAAQKVYLSVDAHEQYRAVKEILDCVQSAGINRIAFLCNPRLL